MRPERLDSVFCYISKRVFVLPVLNPWKSFLFHYYSSFRREYSSFQNVLFSYVNNENLARKLAKSSYLVRLNASPLWSISFNRDSLLAPSIGKRHKQNSIPFIQIFVIIWSEYWLYVDGNPDQQSVCTLSPLI